MAINKVISSAASTHHELKSCLNYVLRSDKIREDYVTVTGPYNFDKVSVSNVAQAFIDEKKLWGKDSGRMYVHSVLSFHKDENISPELGFLIARNIAESDPFYKKYQTLVAAHFDKDELHFHFVSNSVSYVDGKKEQHSKRDLLRLMERTNEYCSSFGLSINKKGKHFDGSDIDELDITAMDNRKYRVLSNPARKSYVIDCMSAVDKARSLANDKASFIEIMNQQGWSVHWSDQRKYITFEDRLGHKVRDSNLSKTFNIDLNKETLIYELERQTTGVIDDSNDGIFEGYSSSAISFGQVSSDVGVGIAKTAGVITSAGTAEMSRLQRKQQTEQKKARSVHI